MSGAYQPGDLVFFNFDGGSTTQHIGLCESYSGTNIITIDGNTGSTSDANGGAVMRRTRPKHYIVGAYRPAYGEKAEEAPEPERSKEQEEELTQAQFNEMFATAMAAYSHTLEAKGVSDWAKSAWDKQVKAGIFDGTKPQAPITREQEATALLRQKKK